MTPERYQALLRWLEARPALKKLVIALNRWLPAVPFACYPLLLVLLNVRWFRLLSANRAAALDFPAQGTFWGHSSHIPAAPRAKPSRAPAATSRMSNPASRRWCPKRPTASPSPPATP